MRGSRARKVHTPHGTARKPLSRTRRRTFDPRANPNLLIDATRMHPCAGHSAIANGLPLCCLPAKIRRVTCLGHDLGHSQSTTILTQWGSFPPRPTSHGADFGTCHDHTAALSGRDRSRPRKAPPTVRRDPTARWSRPASETTPRGAKSRPGGRSGSVGLLAGNKIRTV